MCIAWHLTHFCRLRRSLTALNISKCNEWRRIARLLCGNPQSFLFRRCRQKSMIFIHSTLLLSFTNVVPAVCMRHLVCLTDDIVRLRLIIRHPARAWLAMHADTYVHGWLISGLWMTFNENIGVTRPIAAAATYISSVSIFAEINSRPTGYIVYTRGTLHNYNIGSVCFFSNGVPLIHLLHREQFFLLYDCLSILNCINI